MRHLILAAIVATVSAAEALVVCGPARAASDYWLVDRFPNDQLVVYVDVSTIETASDGTRVAWITWVTEGPGLEKLKWKEELFKEAFDCSRKMTKDIDQNNYAENGDVLYTHSDPYATFADVAPNTIDAGTMDFVCADADVWSKDDRYGHLAAGVLPRTSADFLYSLDHPAAPPPVRIRPR
jgi:hypothetical protein